MKGRPQYGLEISWRCDPASGSDCHTAHSFGFYPQRESSADTGETEG